MKRLERAVRDTEIILHIAFAFCVIGLVLTVVGFIGRLLTGAP